VKYYQREPGIRYPCVVNQINWFREFTSCSLA
jgi:hypothetical protein